MNFSRFRKISRDEKKRRDRTEKEAQAAANRVKFGRTGTEKKLSRLEQERKSHQHEGTRLENKPAEPEDTSTGGNDNAPGKNHDK